MIQHKKRIIGLMSGTSLDGLDLCCADFWRDGDNVCYQIHAATTTLHQPALLDIIQLAYQKEKSALLEADKSFGYFSAKAIQSFIENFELVDIDFVASHGHTVFHQPQRGITVQIGCGEVMANEINIPVINDFRSGDVRLGGQGAPLVPMGDRHLFSAYDSCLNLGGIANISFEQNGKRMAFDIGPANIPINHYIQKNSNLQFDDQGKLAKSGQLINTLYASLCELDYHKLKAPKSLGFEWMENSLFPLCDPFQECIQDLLHTLVHYEAEQIANVLNVHQLKNVLITGGGAYNSFLIDKINERTNCELKIGSPELIEFKEALIFGFLGYLRIFNQTNILASVTGAKTDSCGGIIHHPSM